LDTEYSFSYRGYDYTTTAYAGNNQSFIYYQNAWRDLAAFSEQYYDSGIGNVCIKAYTDKTGTSLAQTKSLKSSSVKKNSAKLTWAKTSGADGYVLYRSTSKNGTYTRVATTRKTSYTDTKLDANTTYYYRVRAYKKTDAANVYGKLSSVVKVTTKKK
jgi:hypothetical protein